MNEKQNTIVSPGHSTQCKGVPHYYDGALGYEAMKCDVCGYELDLNAEANAKATAEREAQGNKAQHSPLPPTYVDMVHLRQERDVALQRVKDCETIYRRAFNQRDAYKAHADKLAEALDDISLWLGRSARQDDIEMAADARRVLVAYLNTRETNQ